MAVLLISPNPLFLEVIAETLSSLLDTELLVVVPEKALEFIDGKHPELLVVDAAVPCDILKGILIKRHNHLKLRLILLDSTGNDWTIIDSYQMIGGSSTDLVSLIKTIEAPNQTAQSCTNEKVMDEYAACH